MPHSHVDLAPPATCYQCCLLPASHVIAIINIISLHNKRPLIASARTDGAVPAPRNSLHRPTERLANAPLDTHVSAIAARPHRRLVVQPPRAARAPRDTAPRVVAGDRFGGVGRDGGVGGDGSGAGDVAVDHVGGDGRKGVGDGDCRLEPRFAADSAARDALALCTPPAGVTWARERTCVQPGWETGRSARETIK